MSEGISEEEYEKKMIKLRQEIEANKLEAERRKAVAQMKTYGFLIEWIDNERDKLEEEKARRSKMLEALVTASGSSPSA